MQKKVVIIGAGPGGLASALLLAGAGFSVTILERQQRVGGRTAALERDGFRFDTGPTFFLYPEILQEVFQAVGADLWQELQLERLDPQYRIQFGTGGHLDATPDIPAMEREIARLCPGDAAGFRPFLEDNRAKLASFKDILQRPFDGWRDVVSLELLRKAPLVRPGASVDGDLKRWFSDPRVRLAFSFQSKYLGMSPFRCPSLFTILSFLEYEHGVFHPIGGCAAVMEKMADLAERIGVEIRCGESVEEIVFEGKRARGVRTDRGLYHADAVVMNADFAHAVQRMVPNQLRRRWTDGKIARKKFSCSTFMMYLGIKGRHDELPHHTIHISSDYEGNLDDIERAHRLSADPSFYVQNAVVTDPTLAPSGHSTLYVLAPVTHEHPNVDWNREAPAFRRKILDQLTKVGIEGVEERIVSETVLTPRDWQTEYAVHKGATFNLAHSLDQMLHLRPRNRFEDVDGMYLVGGGTHPGSGLPVIFESARISSRLLAEDLGVELPVRPSEEIRSRIDRPTWQEREEQTEAVA